MLEFKAMAKRNKDINLEHYAVLGAQQRLREIEEEKRLIDAWLRVRLPKGLHANWGTPTNASQEGTRRIFGEALREQRDQKRRRRRMSPEARKRISEAQKARWAKQKARRATS